MRPPRRLAVLALALVLGLAWWLGCPGSARADQEWPVRINVSMPFGYTSGDEDLHGFTWGFRGSVNGYPIGRLAVGGYAEMLLDAETRSMSSFGGSVAYPVKTWPLKPGWSADWRVGVHSGVRYMGQGPTAETRMVAGIFTEFVIPAYLYELRFGVRVDGTFDDGLTATTMVVDIDIALLLGLLGRAYGR
jgi:hypothetical protein